MSDHHSERPGRGHSHPHAHHHGASDARRLTIAAGLLLAFLLGEVTVGILAGSLALLADAGHMATDVAALVAAVVAARLAALPPKGALTFGLRRAEVLSAAGNGTTLLLVAAIVTIEAVRRLIDPPPVAGPAVLVTALVGVAVNLAAAFVLGDPKGRSINMAGAIAHILTDLYAFAGTAIAGGVVWATGWRPADPIASLLVAALMIKAAIDLLKASLRVLLEAAPADVDLTDLTNTMTGHPSVRSVHDLHVWTITSGFLALSAHVLTDPGGDCHAVRRELERELSERHGIDHTTLQVEHAQPDVFTIARLGEHRRRADP